MDTDERVRLAQELHDGIAQDLVGVGYHIDALIATAQLSPDIRSGLRSLRFTVSELIEKTRSEIFTLRTNSEVFIAKSPLEPSLNYELSRIFAELLRNIAQHSQATSMVMTVSDNGVGGIDAKPGHHGLQGVRERVRDLSGEIAIDSSEMGSKISITVPWRVR